LCLWMALWIAGGFSQELWAEDDVDLYELASAAADAEMKQAEDVLLEEEREHGKQWLTHERLMAIVGGWVFLQVIVLILVVRDLRGESWLVIGGWVAAIGLLGVLAGVLYWSIRQFIVNKSVSAEV